MEGTLLELLEKSMFKIFVKSTTLHSGFLSNYAKRNGTTMKKKTRNFTYARQSCINMRKTYIFFKLNLYFTEFVKMPNKLLIAKAIKYTFAQHTHTHVYTRK